MHSKATKLQWLSIEISLREGGLKQGRPVRSCAYGSYHSLNTSFTVHLYNFQTVIPLIYLQ